MDYLPLPQGVQAQHLRVPFFASAKLHANELFSDFGDRYQASYHDSVRFENERQLADILQSWLYFGLLAEILGEELDPAEFRSIDGPEQTFVELGGIRKRIADLVVAKSNWRTAPADSETPSSRIVGDLETGHGCSGAQVSSPGVELTGISTTANPMRRKRRHVMTLADCLSTSKQKLRSLEPSITRFNSPTIDLIVLSIEILIASLGGTRICDFESTDRQMSPSARLLKRHLLRGGWCIRDCYTMFDLYDIVALYIFAMTRRRTRPSIKHDTCTEALCTAWTILNGSMPSPPTSHVTTDCGCDMIGVPTEELTFIISKGGIPLVSIHRDREGNIVLKLAKWDW